MSVILLYLSASFNGEISFAEEERVGWLGSLKSNNNSKLLYSVQVIRIVSFTSIYPLRVFYLKFNIAYVSLCYLNFQVSLALPHGILKILWYL